MSSSTLPIPFTLLSFLLLLTLIGCDQDDSPCCVVISTNVDILYVQTSGENLINSSSEFDESNIKLYYKNGDAYEYFYNESLDSPGGYRLADDGSGKSILTIFSSYIYEGNQSTTLIELNENVVDTLVGEFDLSGNNQVITRVWLNGIEMAGTSFEVVK